MKYAVIQIQGKQFRVEEGQDLSVDRMPQDEASKIVVSDVLMYVNDGKIEIGTPILSNVSVKMTVTKHEKADKIRVATYKAKSRQRKVHGHRQAETVLHIDAISAK